MVKASVCPGEMISYADDVGIVSTAFDNPSLIAQESTEKRS